MIHRHTNNSNRDGPSHTKPVGAIAVTVRISVVVPTYRRRELLSRCLSALVAQDLDPADYEIIIADDEASDETRSLIDKWRQPSEHRLRYVAVAGKHGPAAARNAGWRTAEGQFIAF